MPLALTLNSLPGEVQLARKPSMIITTLCWAAADVLRAPPGEAAEARAGDAVARAGDAAAIAFDAPPNALAGGAAAKIPAGIISVASKTPAARIALRIMAGTLPGCRRILDIHPPPLCARSC